MTARSNLEYRGHNSSTFRLVLFCFVVGTALLLFGKISGGDWVTGVIGLVSAYVVKEAVAKGAEAYTLRNNGYRPYGAASRGPDSTYPHPPVG